MVHVIVGLILMATTPAQAASVVGTSGPTEVRMGEGLPEPLNAMDLGLNVAACLIVGYAGFEWLRKGRRDPLRHAPVRHNRLRENDVLMVILIYMMAVLVLSVLLAGAAGPRNDPRVAMMVGNGAHLAGIIACLVVASRRFDGGTGVFVLGEPEGRHRVSFLRIIALMVVAIAACPLIASATVLAIHRFAPAFEPPAHPTLSALHEMQSPSMVRALWAGAIIVAPLAEEFFFRGLVQTALVNLLRSRWLAVWVAAGAFGAVHIAQPHVVPALVFLGVLLGYTYERAGSLAAPVLIHAAFNVKNLLWDHYAPG